MIAENSLFQVNKKSNKIRWENSTVFHHNLAKLLLLRKRLRQYAQTIVAFLPTCVK